MEAQELEKALNELIAKSQERGGHVYIVDKLQNTFALKLTEPIKINFYEGYKGEKNGS